MEIISTDIVQVQQAEMLAAINRSEVDIQITTAKKYPRNITEVLNKVATYAMMDTETAEDCFYSLRRQDANGNSSVIEGISVRLAEIIAGAWGNLRIQTRIIGNDGRTITSQGVCHDLETNMAVSVEVKRKITNKSGRTYSEDMQVVTGNAASAIAFRNAVMKVIPRAITKKVVEDIKQVAIGNSLNLETSRQNALKYFKSIGVSEKQLLEYIGKNSIQEIDKKDVFELSGLKTAIKEGDTTIAETFKSDADIKMAEEIKRNAEKAKDKVEEAMGKSSRTTTNETPESK